MPRRVGFILLAFIALIGGGFVVAALAPSWFITLYNMDTSGMNGPRQLPPLYKNAEHVSQKIGPRGNGDSLPKTTVQFTTTDSAEAVATFYTDFMKRAGWDVYNEHAPPNERTIDSQYEGLDGPRYAVLITITSASNAGTGVEISMFAGGSDWHGQFLKPYAPGVN